MPPVYKCVSYKNPPSASQRRWFVMQPSVATEHPCGHLTLKFGSGQRNLIFISLPTRGFKHCTRKTDHREVLLFMPNCIVERLSLLLCSK
jgi:hypothetical protein